MPETGRILIIIGAVFIIAGAFFIMGGKLGPLRYLPGDIVVKKKNFTFIFPLTTSMLISVGLIIVFYLARYFKK